MIALLFFLLHCFCLLHAQISFFCEGGHVGVNRSIQRGCELTGIQYNWNPQDQNEIYPTVVVLAGEGYVRSAINLKQKGIIKKLLVGPNIFVRSCEGGGIMGHPAVDVCLVPSDWVRIAYEQDNPALIGRIAVWPVGVDVEHWSPSGQMQCEKKNVIVYWKTESEFFIQQIARCLQSCGWNSIIVRYGYYNQQRYKELLDHAVFAVFVSISESQGLALAESWSMNIPTIVWDQQYLAAHGREYHIVSSCPYLSKATGVRWKTMSEFEDILKNMQNLLLQYSPRAWILEHMTDEKAICNLMKIIDRIV